MTQRGVPVLVFVDVRVGQSLGGGGSSPACLIPTRALLIALSVLPGIRAFSGGEA